MNLIKFLEKFFPRHERSRSVQVGDKVRFTPNQYRQEFIRKGQEKGWFPPIGTVGTVIEVAEPGIIQVRWRNRGVGCSYILDRDVVILRKGGAHHSGT